MVNLPGANANNGKKEKIFEVEKVNVPSVEKILLVPKQQL